MGRSAFKDMFYKRAVTDERKGKKQNMQWLEYILGIYDSHIIVKSSTQPLDLRQKTPENLATNCK